jgi:hypothetical protein
MATNLEVFYRGPAGNFTKTNKILINNIVISNTSASQQTYTITIADNGNARSLATSTIVPANDTVILDLKQVVPPSQQVAFSGTSCIFHFSGVEIVEE